jgi:hypothetical protein
MRHADGKPTEEQELAHFQTERCKHVTALRTCYIGVSTIWMQYTLQPAQPRHKQAHDILLAQAYHPDDYTMVEACCEQATHEMAEDAPPVGRRCTPHRPPSPSLSSGLARGRGCGGGVSLPSSPASACSTDAFRDIPASLARGAASAAAS